MRFKHIREYSEKYELLSIEDSTSDTHSHILKRIAFSQFRLTYEILRVHWMCHRQTNVTFRRASPIRLPSPIRGSTPGSAWSPPLRLPWPTSARSAHTPSYTDPLDSSLHPYDINRSSFGWIVSLVQQNARSYSAHQLRQYGTRLKKLCCHF